MEATEAYREDRFGLAAGEHVQRSLAPRRHGPSIRPSRRLARLSASGGSSAPASDGTELPARLWPMQGISCRSLQPIRPHRLRYYQLQHRPPAVSPADFATRSRMPTTARASASRVIRHAVPVSGIIRHLQRHGRLPVTPNTSLASAVDSLSALARATPTPHTWNATTATPGQTLTLTPATPTSSVQRTRPRKQASSPSSPDRWYRPR